MRSQIEVLYEDNDIIVINKIAPISFHNEEKTQGLLNLVRDFLKNDRIYSVHRLDKLTTGLILFAKKKETVKALSCLFKDRKVYKLYIAMSDKKPKQKMGTIKGDLVKGRASRWKLARSLNNPSVTSFKSIKFEKKYLFFLEAKTGKTHQLRVVMKSLGSAILGDRLYGGISWNNQNIALHSSILCFELNGKMYRFRSNPVFLHGADLSLLEERSLSEGIMKVNITDFLQS